MLENYECSAYELQSQKSGGENRRLQEDIAIRKRIDFSQIVLLYRQNRDLHTATTFNKIMTSLPRKSSLSQQNRDIHTAQIITISTKS